MSSEKIVIHMNYSKSTKNTHVYVHEPQPSAAIPTLYINKKELSDPPADRIVVTVEEIE